MWEEKEMKKTRGFRKSVTTALLIGTLVVATLGTGVANAITHTHPHGKNSQGKYVDEFWVYGSLRKYSIATYEWISGDHGDYRSSAQRGDSDIVRSARKSYGLAYAEAYNKKGGTIRGWYYNFPD